MTARTSKQKPTSKKQISVKKLVKPEMFIVPPGLNADFLNHDIWQLEFGDESLLPIVNKHEVQFEKILKFFFDEIIRSLQDKDFDNLDIHLKFLQGKISVDKIDYLGTIIDYVTGKLQSKKAPAALKTHVDWIYFLSHYRCCLQTSCNFEIPARLDIKNDPFCELIRLYQDFHTICRELEVFRINSDIHSLSQKLYKFDDRIENISIQGKFPFSFRTLFSFLPEIKSLISIMQVVFREIEFLTTASFDERTREDNINDFKAYLATHSGLRLKPSFFSNPIIKNVLNNLHNVVLLRRSFGDVITKYVLQPGPNTGLKEKYVSVMFCDLREFSALTEELLKIDHANIRLTGIGFLWKTLKLFMGQAAHVIEINHFGWVDKFIGDAVMGVFGLDFGEGNRDRARSATRAMESVFEIRDYINKELRNKMLSFADQIKDTTRRTSLRTKIEHVHSGFGLDFGRVLFGEIGSNSRIDYTVIGNTVNTASRLEAKTKALPGSILFTNDFLKKLIIESDINVGIPKYIEPEQIKLLLQNKNLSKTEKSFLKKQFTSEGKLLEINEWTTNHKSAKSIEKNNKLKNILEKTGFSCEIAALKSNKWRIYQYFIIFLRVATLKGLDTPKFLYTAIKATESNNIEKMQTSVYSYNRIIEKIYTASKMPDRAITMEFKRFRSDQLLKQLHGWEDHIEYLLNKINIIEAGEKWDPSRLITNYMEK